MNFSRGTGGLNLSGPAADKLNRSGLFDGLGNCDRSEPAHASLDWLKVR